MTCITCEQRKTKNKEFLKSLISLYQGLLLGLVRVGGIVLLGGAVAIAVMLPPLRTGEWAFLVGAYVLTSIVIGTFLLICEVKTNARK